MNATAYTVSQINSYLKNVIDDDVILAGFFLEGEISGFKPHSSGHCYFAVKDEESSVNAVMFKAFAVQLGFAPENGMKVIMYGRISAYEKTGQTQFYAEMMEPLGKGALFAAFEQLKNKLEKEGLFARKRSIHKNPACVAVVTSQTGAAIQDIISVTARRAPNVKVVVVPALVQGDGAAKSIAEAIKIVNDWGKADTLIVGRGGGSVEDLWAFNEEAVARAVFASKIPVISAVGHETDFSICDFAADLRAATPSAAAELAVPDVRVRLGYIIEMKNDLDALMERKLALAKETLNKGLTINETVAAYIDSKKAAIGTGMDKLNLLSPFNVLRRGYAIAYNKDGKPIVKATSVKKGDEIELALSDGRLIAQIKSIRRSK